MGTSRRLPPNVRHVYDVDLKAGQLLDVVVGQRGIDVRIDLIGPSGEPLAAIDTPNGDDGDEPVLWVVRHSGSYELVVSAGSHPAEATYVLKVARVRRATSRDRRRAAALQRYYAARDLSHKETDRTKLVQAFQAATKSLQEAGAPRELQAYAWRDLGIADEKEALWPESVASYKKAAALFHRLGMKKREAVALVNVGRGEQELPDIDRALKDFERARLLAHSIGDGRDEATACLYLGQEYAERADANNAELYLQRALFLYEKAHDDGGKSEALNRLALLARKLGKDEEALKICRDALRIQSLTTLDRSALLTELGNLYTHLGRPDSAFRYLQEAYNLQEQEKKLDLVKRANTLVGFGTAYANVRDFENALDSFQKALQIYQGRKDLRSQAITFMNSGWALGSLRRYDDAMDAFQRAYSLAHRLKQPLLEGGALLGLAWTERLRDNLTEARRWGEQALERVESTRSRFTDEDFRIAYFATAQSPYNFLIRTLLDQYEMRSSRDLVEEALHVSESARSRALLDALGEQGGATAAPVLSAREIQQQVLDPDTVLLEYSLGQPNSYLFLVTPSEILCFKLPPESELEPLARETHDALANSRFTQELPRAKSKAWALSRVLLGPVADRLGSKRLLIVPSGVLHLVPFEALPDPAAPESTTDSGPAWPEPLLLRHQIVYEPSASVLAGVRKVELNRKPPSGLLAVLADPVFERDDRRIPGPPPVQRGVGSDPALGYLGRLLASRQEAKAITAGLPASRVMKALGFSANRDLVTGGKLNDFRAIHIATHTYYSPRFPAAAALVLSRFDSLGRPRNGLLRIQDVSRLGLRSDLVVLSSCSSALGKDVPGEGVVGWPWAFLSAGASEVVMSLWNVGDVSTADLMPRFYGNMSRGMSSAEALREAQLAMWKERKPPWHWAGFIAQGEWDVRPLSLNKISPMGSSQSGDPGSPTMTKNRLR